MYILVGNVHMEEVWNLICDVQQLYRAKLRNKIFQLCFDCSHSFTLVTSTNADFEAFNYFSSLDNAEMRLRLHKKYQAQEEDLCQ